MFRDPYIDDVRGEIIGGDDPERAVSGQLFNEGRPQGPVFYAADAGALRKTAIARAYAMQVQYGEAEYRRLYPNGLELRSSDR